MRGEYATLSESIKAGGACSGGACRGNSAYGRATSGSGSGRFDSEVGESTDTMSGILGGWPSVDGVRGMVLLVMDYQSVNVDCRESVREVG